MCTLQKTLKRFWAGSLSLWAPRSSTRKVIHSLECKSYPQPWAGLLATALNFPPRSFDPRRLIAQLKSAFGKGVTIRYPLCTAMICNSFSAITQKHTRKVIHSHGRKVIHSLDFQSGSADQIGRLGRVRAKLSTALSAKVIHSHGRAYWLRR